MSKLRSLWNVLVLLGVQGGGMCMLSSLHAEPVWAAAEAKKKSPRLVFEARSFDFGVVPRGAKKSHRFRFKNEGDATLVIQGVHAACGCTAVVVEQGKDYAPGEGGEVEVKLDTTDFVGPIVKTVTVMSNERPQPDRLLTLKADVRAEIDAAPPLVDFGDVLPKTTPQRQVRLRAIGPRPFTVTGLVFDASLLEASYKKDGADWLVDLTLKSGIAPGFIKETLVVKNDSVNLQELKVPVRANVKGSIELAPVYLEFGAITSKGKAKRSVNMRSASAFKVTGVKSELMINGRRIEGGDKFVKVETSPEARDRQQLVIEIENAAQQAGSVHGKVEISTDEADAKSLTVDFYAFFR